MLQYVGEYIPEEQGLRHLKGGGGTGSRGVGEYIPEEQGLRPTAVHLIYAGTGGRRVYSRRTRIKTYGTLTKLHINVNVGEYIPEEQGLRQHSF